MCEREVVHTKDHPARTELVLDTHPSLSRVTDTVTRQQRCSDLLSSLLRRAAELLDFLCFSPFVWVFQDIHVRKTLPDRALDARILMERALDFLHL